MFAKFRFEMDFAVSVWIFSINSLQTVNESYVNVSLFNGFFNNTPLKPAILLTSFATLLPRV